jgi:hypothetical protein
MNLREKIGTSFYPVVRASALRPRGPSIFSWSLFTLNGPAIPSFPRKAKNRRTPSPSPSTAAPRPGRRHRTTPPLLPHSLLACPRHPHTSLHLFYLPTPPPHVVPLPCSLCCRPPLPSPLRLLPCGFSLHATHLTTCAVGRSHV